MSRLLVVACGGTISSVPPSGGASPAVPRLGAEQLVAAVPGLADLGADVETRTHATLASSAMTLTDVLALRTRLHGWAQDAPGGSGIVVTHGTDTLEETAYALDLLWDLDVPLVVTGAMRHAGLPGHDGGVNLADAALTALSPDARGAGVLVVAAGRVHLAATVHKSHTTDVGTFVSPTLGPVGWVSEGRPVIALARRHRPLLPVVPASVTGHPVALVRASLGDDGRVLAGLVDAGYRGLVVEGLGGGHLHPAMVDRLPVGLPVLLASRTGAGPVLTGTYGFPGSETDLIARGVIPAGVLDGAKARVLLTLLLAAGTPPADLPVAVAGHAHLGG